MNKQTPIKRIKYSGSTEKLIQSLCNIFGVGNPITFSIVEVGYEDCNVVIETLTGKYLAKVFSEKRSDEEVVRYTTIMERAVDAGVNHPPLMRTHQGGYVGKPTKEVSAVLMKFIEGKTFLELDRAPDDEERQEVLEQAAKVNKIGHHPPYLFDSWAIPNIQSMFARVRQYIDPSDIALIEQAITHYAAIPIDELVHCFVHGDFTKANVLKGNDGKIYILDFSVSNWYPRVQELAVIAANLLYDADSPASLKEKCSLITEEYNLLNPLTKVEQESLYDYAVAGVAMEFMGSHQERYINGNDTEETQYWFNLGREGLRKALGK